MDAPGHPSRTFQASRIWGAAAVFGVVTFLTVVIGLQILQPEYHPSQQLMSELALGSHGWAMFFAFAGIAFAMICVQVAIAACGASLVLRSLILAAAALFLAAGVFPLGESSTIHIAAVSGAFVAAVLAQYLFPSLAGRAAELAPKSFSWVMAAGLAISVALGHSLLPMGIGQRLAAACLLIWLVVLGWKLARSAAK